MPSRLASVAVAITATCTLILATAASPLVAEDAALVRARALLDKVPLVDGHNDLPWTLREGSASDLTRIDLR